MTDRDRKISELDTLNQVDVQANADFLVIADVSEDATKKLTPAAVVFSALGSLSSLSVGGTVSIGSGSASGQLTSNGEQNLFLTTNSGVNSGVITLNQGLNGNIELSPNGSGDVLLTADTVRVGDSNVNATLTTNGTGDLILNTNSGTNSGTIRIFDGVNGNIELTTNGTGAVIINAASGLTISNQGTTANSVTTKQYVDIQAIVSGIVFGV
jgi:hypothetical protein